MEVSGQLHAAAHLSQRKWAVVHTEYVIGRAPGAGLHTAADLKLGNHTAALQYLTIHIFVCDGPNTGWRTKFHTIL